MVEAAERVVNLALFLADARQPVGRKEIQGGVDGYSEDQAEDAFLRMFERDKEQLRQSGFVIETNEQGLYWLDTDATYFEPIELSADEAAALKATGDAFSDDPAFPFHDDLRLALTKLAEYVGTPDVSAAAALVEERPAEQGAFAGALLDAAEDRKLATFTYTTALDSTAERHVEPYGLFVRDGRWYLVGRDVDRAALRVFALERLSGLTINEAAPKTHDFERPEDFDVAAFIMLPFQYGKDEPFTAVLRFDPSVAWRAASLAAHRGSLELDGEARWTVECRNRVGLARFAIENGPGITVEQPRDLDVEIAELLQEVIRVHG